MTSAIWRLLGTLALGGITACTGRFEFDVPAQAGAGSAGEYRAGTAPASNVDGDASDADEDDTDEDSVRQGVADCVARCKELGAQCAPEWLVCVECNRDADCMREDRRRCDGVLHRCVQCGVDADCGVHMRCDVERRDCVEACNDMDGDAICTEPGSVCDMERGVCVVCDSDASCSGVGYCGPTGTRCTECVADEQCPSDRPYCDPVLFECVVCRDARDCADTGCNPESHTCF